MRRITILFLGLLLCLLALPPVGQVEAQANLITNPGLEQPYNGANQRSAANGWTAWVGNGNADFYQEQYGSVRSGGRSQAIQAIGIIRDVTRLDVGIYQVVGNIPVGSRVRASAWASIWMYDVPNPATAGAQLQIGIDPNGGANAGDGDIAWSGVNASAGRVDPNDNKGWVLPYTQIAVETTTTGGSVTVFLRWQQTWGGREQRAFFDDVSLVVVQAGTGTAPTVPGATAAPPAATAMISSFAIPQAPQADGSIIHTVQPGNTLNAIATAYGTTVDAILALNPTLTNGGRFIYPGQQLLIRAVPGAATANPSAEASEIVAPTLEGTPGTTQPTATFTLPPTITVQAPPTLEPSPTLPPTAPVVTGVGTAATQSTAICFRMFEDRNMDQVQGPDEGLLAGGAVTLQQGSVNLGTKVTTSSPEPWCFENLTAGEYTLTVAPPPGYGLTVSSSWDLLLQTGETVNMLPFGAVQGGVAAVPSPVVAAPSPTPVVIVAETSNDSELIRNIGIIVFGLAGIALLGGVGLAFILRRR